MFQEFIGNCPVSISQEVHDDHTDDTIIRDALKERDLEEFTHNEKNQHYMCLWQHNSDISGRGGAWAYWSGIWLSHLLQKAMKSLSLNHIGKVEVDKDREVRSESCKSKPISLNHIGKVEVDKDREVSSQSWKSKENLIRKLTKRRKLDIKCNAVCAVWKHRSFVNYI